MRRRSRATVAGAVTAMVAVAAVPGWAQTPDDQWLSTAQSIVIELDAAAPGTRGGEAVLTAEGAGTVVEVELSTTPASGEIAAFLVAGGCTESGEVIASLGVLEAGPSGGPEVRAEVPVELAEIAEGVVAVEVRAVDDVDGRALFCGAHAGRGDADAPAPDPAAELPPQPLPAEELPAEPVPAEEVPATPLPEIPLPDQRQR